MLVSPHSSLRAARPALLALVFCCAGAPVAHAQDTLFKREANVGVLERPRPGYEALGVRAGAFLLYPSVTFRVEHDNNLYAEPDGVSDVILSVAPNLDLRSDWGRHAVSLSLDANIKRHDKYASEDSDTWGIAGKGRLDVSRSTIIEGRASYADRVESRATSDYEVEPIHPIEYTTDAIGVTARHDFARARLIATADLVGFDYDDAQSITGGVIDEDYRDHTEADISAKLALAISPATAVFAEVGAQERSYDGSLGRNRDSSGFTGLVGVDMELTRLVTGEASVGYISQDFDDPTYDDISNPHFRVRFDWYPTELITVGLTATQRVIDSSLEDSPAYVNRKVELRADYELLRNLIITAQLQGGDEDYRGIDRRDRRYGAGLSANYLMNRTVGVSVRYKYETVESSGADRGQGFDDQSVSLALVLQR